MTRRDILILALEKQGFTITFLEAQTDDVLEMLYAEFC